MSKKKTVSLTYTADSTGRGAVGKIKTQAEFLKLEPQGVDYLRHDNHQPILFVDEGGNSHQDKDKPDVQIRPRMRESLANYLLRAGMNPIKNYRWKSQFPGNFYVPEHYRYIIRSLISVIAYYHSRDLSLVDSTVLTLDNIGVYQGSISLTGVSTCAATNATKVKDYAILHKFISHILFNGQPTTLKDMEHLLDRMVNVPSVITDKYDKYLEYHVATMKHAERVRFMTSCYEAGHMLKSGCQKHLFSSTNYHSALRAFGNNSGWDRKINQSSFGPVIRAFQGGSVQINYKTSTSTASHHSIEDVNLDFLRACRNILSHFGQNVQRGDPYTDRDCDNMMMGIFADEFAKFHKCLYDQKLLFEVIKWDKRRAN